jgi:amino acid transporter
MLLFFVPLGVTVADLGSRYPDEGGIYVWSREAWGDFHGFLTAWAYWTANLGGRRTPCLGTTKPGDEH